jgi:hypothetical protein
LRNRGASFRIVGTLSPAAGVAAGSSRSDEARVAEDFSPRTWCYKWVASRSDA